MDIDAGSGGGGSGGGGRSYNAGLNGSSGGAGGGMIMLVANDSLIVGANALLSVAGENGNAGGTGGDGGASSKCCSDGCDDCAEATLSCGAGGGSGSGGGSGGGILLQTNGYSLINGMFIASGGNGGAGGGAGNGSSWNYSNIVCTDNDISSGVGNTGNTGGGGGGGRIKIFVASDCGSVNATMVANGGSGGNGTATAGTTEVICTTSLDDNSNEPLFSVYPNPAETDLWIRLNDNSETAIITVVIPISPVAGSERKK
jgi:hypothetical protein